MPGMFADELAPRAAQVLQAVARCEVFRASERPARDVYQPSDMSESQPVTTFTTGLRAYGLVRLNRKVTEPAIANGERVRMWDVTTEGRTLLARMGSNR